MKISSHAIRREGLEYLKKYLGELPKGDIRVANLIPSEKARTKSPVWWLQPSLKKLNDGEKVHLLCKKENGKGFHYLSVPVKDVEKYLNNGDLERRLQKGREFIHLEISARPEDLFQDLRKGRRNFAEYLVELLDKD